MVFARVVLLQLLWASLASASHFYAGSVTCNAKKDSQGKFHVEMRNKATFRGCEYQIGTCRQPGTCGHNSRVLRGVIDSSPNSATSGTWCQTESVVSKILTTDKPFETRESSCCYISLRISPDPAWSVKARVDLGTRSDTRAPNNSPDIAIMPFLRAPQNCRRSYSALFVDSEGDVVRCRYGNRNAEECSDCRRQIGFQLNEATCTLQYLGSGNQGNHAFELVVEDHPKKNVIVSYLDGSRSQRYGVLTRKKRWMMPMSTTAGFTTTTAPPTTTTVPWWHTTTTGPPTTTINIPWWRWHNATTGPPKTTTIGPSTNATTTPPTNTTTTAPPNTTTTGPPTITTTTKTPLSWRTPFSIMPLQLIFKVDPPVPSCTEGLYLPQFVGPTPRHGEVIMAQVGKEVEIRVKAQAQYSVVDNIIMTGPLNMTKHRTTGDVFTIKWTPTEENLEDYFPICFVVEFKSGSSIYQTEMRCVMVNVTGGLINTVVTCKESSMTVEVEKATLPRIHYDDLHLSDASNKICSLQTHSNSTHVVAIVPLNRCGTQVDEDEDDLIFKNEITTVDSNSSLITRRHQVEIRFECEYKKTGNVTTSFSAHRDKVTVWDKGLGEFTYGFEFFPDQGYRTMIDPRLYPLDYDVGNRIFMEIEATTTVDNTELFVVSCEASPYDNPSYKKTYSIIADGCDMDSTLIRHSVSHKRQFRFSLEAFKFIGLHDQVYISCSVMMCEAGNPLTRCSKGCQPRRHKREAAIESASHYVSQGPLRLKRSVEAAGNTGLNLNIVFIAGCVLAALGMICGVIFFKAKKSTVKYHPLSSEEN